MSLVVYSTEKRCIPILSLFPVPYTVTVAIFYAIGINWYKIFYCLMNGNAEILNKITNG